VMGAYKCYGLEGGMITLTRGSAGLTPG